MNRIEVADLVKGTPEGANVLLLSACSSKDDNVISWVKEEVEGYLSKTDAAVASVCLSDSNIHQCVGCFSGGGRVCGIPCDRNDISSDIYQSDDGMLVLHQKLLEAQAVVLLTDSRFGGSVNPVVHTFLDRLSPFLNLSLEDGKENPLVGKPCAVACIGSGTGDSLFAPLMALGFKLLPFVHWGLNERSMPEVARTAFKRSKTLHENIEKFVSDITSTLKVG